jgi:hypothetical protein
MNSLASKSPIVEGIVIRILNTYPIHIDTKEKHLLDTDLVPKIHDSLVKREKLQESMIHTEEKNLVPPKKLETAPQNLVLQEKKESKEPWETYKKIIPMLNDPFVSYIECKGPNAKLSVVKNGRSQITNISMDRAEIDEYLKFLSEKTRLPLVEGVFNARVDDYTINAVISNSIEPSFIIKKNLVSNTNYMR